MIDWLKHNPGEIFKLNIYDDNEMCFLDVKLVEYEWSLNRQPFMVDILIINSSNVKEYPNGSTIRLPLKTGDFENFLLQTPCNKEFGSELKRKGNITIN